MIAAAEMTIGNGIRKTNSARNASAATTTCIGCFSDRFATRHSASATKAITAHFNPKNTPMSQGSCPKAA